MTAGTTATLECKVCGAGWGGRGEMVSTIGFSFCNPEPDLHDGRGVVQMHYGEVFYADEPQECPECGEADVWDIAEPEGIE